MEATDNSETTVPNVQNSSYIASIPFFFHFPFVFLFDLGLFALLFGVWIAAVCKGFEQRALEFLGHLNVERATYRFHSFNDMVI